jgi:ureidoacrylate peracid hydrolase
MLTTLAEKVAPEHTALVVIDMQNDFCDDEGACARNGDDVRVVQAIVPTLHTLTAAARRAGALVVFVRVSHDESTDSEVRLQHRRGHKLPVCTEGTWGVDWYADLRPQQGDVVVTKHRFSAFINTPLDLILRSRQIRTLVVTGTATNVCVESTARDGHMLDYYVVFPEDGAASPDLAAHEATLHNIRKHFGDVVKADGVVQVWALV